MTTLIRRGFSVSSSFTALAILLAIAPFAAAQDIYLTNRGNPSTLYEINLETMEAEFLLRFQPGETVHALAACAGENRLYGIDRNTQDVFIINLEDIPLARTSIGRVDLGFQVVQFACSPAGVLYFSNNNTEELYTLNPGSCDPDTGVCAVEQLGVVESSPNANDVDIQGADIEFNPQGDLFLLSNGTIGNKDRALYRVDLNSGGGCDNFSCPATRLGGVDIFENNMGMTILPGGQLIIASNDDNIYEVDSTNALVNSLGPLTINGNTFNINNGDMTALIPCPPTLDFENAANGLSINAGDIASDQWASQGITITTNDPQNHPAMIFDSANPTGGDDDLGTPNQNFGGPGVGAGGESSLSRNALPRGKILMISENGDSSDPEVYDDGGWIDFTFSPVVATVSEIQVLNSVRTDGKVIAYDQDGNVIVERSIAYSGKNGYQSVPVGAFNVARIRVVHKDELGISAVLFCGACGVNY